jgi:hypothetical protein
VSQEPEQVQRIGLTRLDLKHPAVGCFGHGELPSLMGRNPLRQRLPK